MTSTANRSTPNYITRYSGATGKPELVCKHCGGAIAQTYNPRQAEYSHIDLQDEGHPGFNCGDENSPLAEPATVEDAIWSFMGLRADAQRIRRAIARGEVTVSPAFAALAAAGDDAALILAAAKTEGGAQ